MKNNGLLFDATCSLTRSEDVIKQLNTLKTCLYIIKPFTLFLLATLLPAVLSSVPPLIINVENPISPRRPNSLDEQGCCRYNYFFRDHWGVRQFPHQQSDKWTRWAEAESNTKPRSPDQLNSEPTIGQRILMCHSEITARTSTSIALWDATVSWRFSIFTVFKHQYIQ